MAGPTTKRQLFSIFVISVFMGILILPTAIWGVLLLLNNSTPQIMKSLDYDLGENRVKAELPEQFDAATFPAELEAYYNDRVPFRSVIISANNKLTNHSEEIYKTYIRTALINVFYANQDSTSSDMNASAADLENLFGSETSTEEVEPSTPISEPLSPSHNYGEFLRQDPTCTANGYVVYSCADCREQYTETLSATGHDYQVLETVEPDYDNYGYTLKRCATCELESKLDFTEKLIDTSYLPPNILNEYTIEGRRNWLFYAGNASVSYYRGRNLLDEETLADYSTRVATLQEICDAKGIQLVLMIIPNKEQVYAEYMPTYTIEDTYKRVPRLVDYVKEQTGIEILYPLEELQTAKLYWQTYYKYDTHWNDAGAFVGTQIMNQALGLPTTNITDVTYDVTYRYGGDLVALGALDPANYPNDPVFHINYKEEVTILDTTGDPEGAGIYTSQSDSPNQCNFVMVGDSFRNRMLPYVGKDFSNCLFTHRDHLGNTKVINAIKEADVLVLTTAERYDNRMMNNVSTIIDILSEEDSSSE